MDENYIELDLKSILNNSLDDWFYMRDLNERKLCLNTDVTPETVNEIVSQILSFNMEDKNKAVEERKPIKLFICSDGGSVDSGFELIDVILASKTPVYTINLGYWYSMGLLIGMAGEKRFATKNAKFLMHDGSGIIYNSSSKMRDQARFYEELERRSKEYILHHSNITEEEYDKQLRVEWYMFADEAKERGLIDCIIGEDCDLDSVL